MKNEKIFSKNGFYQFVVQTNLMFHTETIEIGIQILKSWLQKQNPKQPIRVLDLACGGLPISITQILGHFKDVDFEYFGVDINPDQIELAKTFDYPDNMTQVNLQEGNAWDLFPQMQNQKFDFIFSGMNFHHGTPEELYFLANQLQTILKPKGLLLSHDEYRPHEFTYLRRPSHNPKNPNESFELVEENKLTSVPNLKINESQQDWRTEMIDSLMTYVKRFSDDEKNLAQELEHVSARDYPVSTEEITSLFAMHGFKSKVHDYEPSNRPLKKYFKLVEFWKV